MAQASTIAKQVAIWFVPTVLIVGLSSFIVISSLVGFFPQTFGPIFGGLGLFSLRETGVYADCSLYENRNNSLCSGIRNPREDRAWNGMKRSKKSLPFNLHGN